MFHSRRGHFLRSSMYRHCRSAHKDCYKQYTTVPFLMQFKAVRPENHMRRKRNNRPSVAGNKADSESTVLVADASISNTHFEKNQPASFVGEAGRLVF